MKLKKSAKIGLISIALFTLFSIGLYWLSPSAAVNEQALCLFLRQEVAGTTAVSDGYRIVGERDSELFLQYAYQSAGSREIGEELNYTVAAVSLDKDGRPLSVNREPGDLPFSSRILIGDSIPDSLSLLLEDRENTLSSINENEDMTATEKTEATERLLACR